MASTPRHDPIVDERTENPRVLRLAGGLLFALGLIAAAMAYFGAGADKVDMVLYAAVLLSLGYPMLLYVGALKKIAVLEGRIAELERRSGE